MFDLVPPRPVTLLKFDAIFTLEFDAALELTRARTRLVEAFEHDHDAQRHAALAYWTVWRPFAAKTGTGTPLKAPFVTEWSVRLVPSANPAIVRDASLLCETACAGLAAATLAGDAEQGQAIVRDVMYHLGTFVPLVQRDPLPDVLDFLRNRIIERLIHPDPPWYREPAILAPGVWTGYRHIFAARVALSRAKQADDAVSDTILACFMFVAHRHAKAACAHFGHCPDLAHAERSVRIVAHEFAAHALANAHHVGVAIRLMTTARDLAGPKDARYADLDASLATLQMRNRQEAGLQTIPTRVTFDLTAAEPSPIRVTATDKDVTVYGFTSTDEQ